jgi:hypothetical protein
MLEVRDQGKTAGEDKGASNWQDEVRNLTFKPDSSTKSGDKTNEVTAKRDTAETPEVKAAYQKMLEKTKGVDPVAVADSINLFGDLAAANGNVPKLSMPVEKNDNKAADNGIVDPNAVEERVAKAYTGLLQRGLNPVLIVDVLNVAGDVAAIAMSPQGKKLFEDIKTLISHIRG